MELLILTFPAALLAGLVFGAGACSVGCLPLLGPVLFVRGGGIGGAWRTLLPFSAGRVTGYTTLGAVAGGFGYALTELFDGWGGPLLGAATIAAGLLLLRRRRPGCTPHREQRVATASSRLPWPLTLFGMGAGMALTPCAPLTTLLTGAAATGSAAAGALVGLGFGLGAVAAPALLFGTLVAHLGAELRAQLGNWLRPAQTVSGLALVAVGVATAGGLLRF